VMLWNRREPLIQQVLEAVVVGFDDEPASPKVRPPVPDRHDEPNELPFVGRQRLMSVCDSPTEESDGWPSWTITAPKPWDDASHSTTNGLEKSGMARTGAEVTASLSAANAAAAFLLHENSSFFNKVVNGAALVP
jgi:hypothetical protein